MTEGNLNVLCDSRFNYKTDNPFTGPTKNECLDKLKQYIRQNINNFKDVDWIFFQSFSLFFSICFGIKIPEFCEKHLQLNFRI